MIDECVTFAEQLTRTIDLKTHERFEFIVMLAIEDLCLSYAKLDKIFLRDIDSTDFEIATDILPEIR